MYPAFRTSRQMKPDAICGGVILSHRLGAQEQARQSPGRQCTRGYKCVSVHPKLSWHSCFSMFRNYSPYLTHRPQYIVHNDHSLHPTTAEGCNQRRRGSRCQSPYQADRRANSITGRDPRQDQLAGVLNMTLFASNSEVGLACVLLTSL